MIKINPHLFFYIENGEVICWNYISHEQFSIDLDYLQRLFNISIHGDITDNQIDQDLLEYGLLEKPPFSKREEWGWDILSLIFHKGTQDIPLNEKPSANIDEWIENYLYFSESIIDDMPPLFIRKKGATLDLPEPKLSDLEKHSFLDVINKRKTSRSFRTSNISLQDTSTLLFSSLGNFHKNWLEINDNNLEITGIRKTSPSGGGLHCEEAYLIAFEIEDLEKGVYHYGVKNHDLTLIEQGDFRRKLIDILYQQYFCENISFGIFITARFDKAWWKYKHSRAYRNVLMDVGHVSQTLQLCATALDYQTWISGAFSDTEVNSLLKLDTSKENTLFFVGIGKSDMNSFDKRIINHLRERNR